jgi:hypothetical protein
VALLPSLSLPHAARIRPAEARRASAFLDERALMSVGSFQFTDGVGDPERSSRTLPDMTAGRRRRVGSVNGR